ncbi:MAG TPA: hypothetical protein VGB49_09210, partial [Caulobacteraceae bacterium]
LFVGAGVASRAARRDDGHRGGLHGLSVWALSFFLALSIAGSSLVGGASAVADEPETGSAASALAGDVIAPDAPGGPATGDGPLVVPREDRAEADRAAGATATLALWGFLTMLLGAVAAVIGGMYGTRRHRWMDKAGIGDGVHGSDRTLRTETTTTRDTLSGVRDPNRPFP